MTHEEKESLINDIIKYWGKEHQLNIAVEECAELIQAIIKKRRYGKDKAARCVKEEIVDVLLMMDQLDKMYNGPYYRNNMYDEMDEEEAEKEVIRICSETIGLINESDYLGSAFASLTRKTIMCVRNAVSILSKYYFDDEDIINQLIDYKLLKLKVLMDTGEKERNWYV